MKDCNVDMQILTANMELKLLSTSIVQKNIHSFVQVSNGMAKF